MRAESSANGLVFRSNSCVGVVVFDLEPFDFVKMLKFVSDKDS